MLALPFTQAAASAKNLIMWWNTLTPVEQSSISNINMLVSSGEQIKMAEVGAWADASREQQQEAGQLSAHDESEPMDGLLKANDEVLD